MPVIINDVEVVLQEEPQHPQPEAAGPPSTAPGPTPGRLPAGELRRILAAAEQRRTRLLAD